MRGLTEPYTTSHIMCALRAFAIQVSVSDKEDGLYRCEFRASVSGQYKLTISLHGAPLPGSPFELQVLRPKPSAQKCVLSGPGLKSAVARTATYFEIEFRDAFGQLAHSEEVQWQRRLRTSSRPMPR